MPTLYVLNKIDSITIEELDLIDQVLMLHFNGHQLILFYYV